MRGRAYPILALLLLACCCAPDEPSVPVGSYALRLSSHAAMPQGAAPFDVNLEARLEIVPGAARDRWVVRFVNPRFEANSPEQRAEFDKLAQEIARPFTIKVSDGRVIEHRVAAGLGAFSVALLRSVTSALQLPTARDLDEPRLEWDSTGEYEARYERAPDGYRRQKVAYKRVLGAAPASPSQLPQLIRSAAELRLRDGILVGVKSREVVRTPLLNALAIEVTNELELVREGEPASFAFDEQAFAAQSKLVASHDAYLDPTPQRAFAAARIGEHTFEEVVATLESEALAEEGSMYGQVNGQAVTAADQQAKEATLAKRFGAFEALTGMFAQSEPLVSAAVARIRAGSPAGRTMMSALVAVGQADRLVALARDRQLDLALRRSAVSALLRSEQPSPAAIALLRELGADDDFEEHVRYGLGTFSRRLRAQGDAARADALVQPLLDELPTAREERRKVILLRGLSNAGYPGALGVVRPFVEDRSSAVREAALEALCLVPDPEVDALYAERLRAEPEESLRELLLRRVAQHRKPTPVLLRALATQLYREESAGVRRLLFTVLGAWRSDSAEARAALERAARGNDATLRALAQQELGSVPAGAAP